jgi:hypothetical protein
MQMVCASEGNLANSFKAALIHEMGRVFLVIGILRSQPSNVVRNDYTCQGTGGAGTALRAWGEWIASLLRNC